MQTAQIPAQVPTANTAIEEVRLRKDGGEPWSLTEKNLFRRVGLTVTDFHADPGLIAVRGIPRGGSYERAVGHRKFSIEAARPS